MRSEIPPPVTVRAPRECVLCGEEYLPYGCGSSICGLCRSRIERGVPAVPLREWRKDEE